MVPFTLLPSPQAPILDVPLIRWCNDAQLLMIRADDYDRLHFLWPAVFHLCHLSAELYIFYFAVFRKPSIFFRWFVSHKCNCSHRIPFSVHHAALSRNYNFWSVRLMSVDWWPKLILFQVKLSGILKYIRIC